MVGLLRAFGLTAVVFVGLMPTAGAPLVLRPAPKNQMRSFQRKPPSVPSYTLMALSGCLEVSIGVSEIQSALVTLSRNEPEDSLPPDLVSVLTTPPLNRPYSAEIAPVRIVVS